MKLDPHHERQKYTPMILVSGNIRCMRIFDAVSLGGGVKWQWGCGKRQFLAFGG